MRGNQNESAHAKVTICHATGSTSNPFVEVTPSAAGVFNGHLGHQDGRDIIPPFQYKGQTYSQNWDAIGQATFGNGCEQKGTQTPVQAAGAPASNGSAKVSVNAAATPVAATPAGGQAGTEVRNGVVFITASTPLQTPLTTVVNRTITIIVRAKPLVPVSVQGAGVLGATKTISNRQGVARIRVLPTKPGVLTVSVNNLPVKRVGVLGAQASGAALTG